MASLYGFPLANSRFFERIRAQLRNRGNRDFAPRNRLVFDDRAAQARRRQNGIANQKEPMSRKFGPSQTLPGYLDLAYSGVFDEGSAGSRPT
jgi:hypothetical protein